MGCVIFLYKRHPDKNHSRTAEERKDKLGWWLYCLKTFSKENEFSNEYNKLKSVGSEQGKRDLNTKISMAWLDYFE